MLIHTILIASTLILIFVDMLAMAFLYSLTLDLIDENKISVLQRNNETITATLTYRTQENIMLNKLSWVLLIKNFFVRLFQQGTINLWVVCLALCTLIPIVVINDVIYMLLKAL